ncbi:hypothetical protein [Cellulomonas endophytica]|uniref:hypothetical protein n=1 Tax=Cellulomonas endophytica TaxID=2494735 RepID=UPI001012B551|nr:hypothetical protein [Cellulomonas endophytica]
MSTVRTARPGLRGLVARVLALALVAGTAVTAGVAGQVATAPPAAAADARDFDPGSIISDSVFYDPGTMSAGQIQTFLDARGSSCVDGERPCLKRYTEDTPSRPAEAGLCAGYAGAAGESAATIVARVADSCGVNPRVLLVLLEKEQSLVTRTRPTLYAYQRATGFGCPDTAPCDAEYFGFSNQVYRAARQYKVYASRPTRYAYQAGRTNTIGYHPNAVCGSAQVTIRNQATAGLYIYTPYVPNAAAMANLYGSGDSCSAYGNRNFWRIFTDWFGSTQAGSHLLRTATDDRVWLVVDQERYHVRDLAMLDALAPLGPVGVVSQTYLDRRADRGPASPFVVDRGDGAVYLLDRGTRRHFRSCTDVAAYGASCGALTALNPAQVDLFADRGDVTRLVRTPQGQHYWVTDATLREIPDLVALQATLPGVAPTDLPRAAVAHLPVGVPVVRDATVAVRREDGAAVLVDGGATTSLDASLMATPLWGLPRGVLDGASIERLGAGGVTTGVFADGARRLLLTTDGLLPLADAGTLPVPAPPASTALRRALGVLPAATAPPVVKEPGTPTVWRLEAGVRRAVGSWADLVALTGGTPAVRTVATSTLARAATGTPVLSPGTLVRPADGAEIYLVDGVSGLVHVDALAVPRQLGLTGWTTVPRPALAGYTVARAYLSPVLTCFGRSYLGDGTGPVLRTPAVADPPTLPVTRPADATCRALPLRTPPAPERGPVFVRSAAADTVYLLTATQRRPVTGWSALVSLAGSPRPLIAVLSDASVAAIPLGAPAP